GETPPPAGRIATSVAKRGGRAAERGGAPPRQGARPSPSASPSRRACCRAGQLVTERAGRGREPRRSADLYHVVLAAREALAHPGLGELADAGLGYLGD